MDSAKKWKEKNKRRHAYALRDFDETKILQRRFFKDFHFDTDKTDEEILQSLQETEKKSLDDMEQSQKTIKATYERLDKFHELLNRHQTRLSKFSRMTTKVANSDILLVRQGTIEYFTANLSTMELMEKFKNAYYTLEKKIQKRYREEFAARLKRARLAAGFTQKQLGDMIQISPHGYGQYENGKRDPSIPTICRLLKILSAERLLEIK